MLTNKVVSWLTTVPVGDYNWVLNARKATLEELQEALSIARDLNNRQTGHKTRVRELERYLRRKQQEVREVSRPTVPLEYTLHKYKVSPWVVIRNGDYNKDEQCIEVLGFNADNVEKGKPLVKVFSDRVEYLDREIIKDVKVKELIEKAKRDLLVVKHFSLK